MKYLTHGLVAGLLSLAACQSTGQKPTLVNNIRQLNQDSATAIPFTDQKTYLVTGRVSGTLYIFGKGGFLLADLDDANEKITVLSGTKHKVGQILTLRLEREEALNFGEHTVTMYKEP